KRRAALKRRSHASPPVIGMRVAMAVGVKMGTGMIVPATCALAMRGGVGVIDAAQRAALAPDAVAVLVMLLLPDRAGVLHLLDQLAAGAEGLVAVRGTRGHHHRQVAHAEASPGMRDVQPDLRSEARIDLFGDGPEAIQRQGLEHVVADAGDHAAVVEVAHAADEHRHAAEAGIGHELERRRGIQRAIGDVGHRAVEAFHVQPPLTGGSTAIATPGTRASASRITVLSLAKAEAFNSSGRNAGQCSRAWWSSASRRSATRAPSGTSSSTSAAGSCARNAPNRLSCTFTPAPLRSAGPRGAPSHGHPPSRPPRAPSIPAAPRSRRWPQAAA